MDSAHHERLSALFAEAIEQPVDQRDAWIDARTADAPELRAELLELLRLDALESGVAAVDTPALGTRWSAARLEQAPAAAHPERLGPYEILDVLGEGGMGTVYRARQKHPARDVALKVVRAGMAGAETLRRFELEAQLLGRLSHPCIAQVHEAGVAETDAGPRPFLAMELVDGKPLDAWVGAARPSRRERLELLATLCEAVGHAHAKGVIHRDLKPANVLVDATGRPRVLDFGVARAVDARADDASLLTRAGQLVGTLAYMSPEQAGGDPEAVDVRSDVYTLGVIAYELLAERLPLDVAGRTLTEAARSIREDEPAPLGRVDRALRGDLETIVAKALEKDPARRYASATALAQDLRRHLAHEPIVARPASALYQLGKLARRHRALVAGASLALLALVVGAGVSLWQARAATVARDDSLAVNDFLADLLGSLRGEDLGRAVLVSDVLERASARLERETNPAVRTRLDAIVGRSFESLGEAERALVHLDRALVGFDALGLADSDAALDARTRRVQALATLGRRDDALVAAREVWRDSARVLGPDDDATLRRAALLASAELAVGEPHAALERLRPLVDALAAGPRAGDALHLELQLRLASVLRELGRFEEVPALAARLAEELPASLGDEHPLALDAVQLHADVSQAVGHLAEADAALQRAAAILAERRGPDHGTTLDAQLTRGLVLTGLARYDDAEALLVDVIARAEAAFGAGHPRTLQAREMLLQLYFESGRAADGVEPSRALVAAREAALGELHPDTLDALLQLGMLCRDALKRDEAFVAFETLQARAAESGDPRTPQALQAVVHLADLHREDGDPVKAAALLEPMLPTIEEIHGPDSPTTFVAWHVRAGIHDEAGEVEQARVLYERVLEGRRRVLGPQHRHTLQAAHALAFLLSRHGRHEEALPHAREAAEGYVATLGADNIYGQLGLNALGTALQGLGRFEELIEELEDATHLISEEDLPGTFPGTGMVLRVGSAYRSLGRHAEASPFYERAARAMLARNGPTSRDGTSGMAWWADSVRAEGRWADALEVYREGWPAFEQSPARWDAPTRWSYLYGQGRCLLELDRAQEARTWLENSLAVARAGYGEEDVRTKASLEALARIPEG